MPIIGANKAVSGTDIQVFSFDFNKTPFSRLFMFKILLFSCAIVFLIFKFVRSNFRAIYFVDLGVLKRHY